MPTDLQLELFNKIREGICGSVQYNLVSKNAIEVATPFVDWKGSKVSVYITENGHLTDGGQVLSQLKSLRVIDNYYDWNFKEDFLNRYCIQQVRGNLEASNVEFFADILKYIQGVTRLPNYFESKPIYSIADNFPTKVEKVAKEALMNFVPSDMPHEERAVWVSEFTKERRIPYNGIEVKSDMSPTKYYRMIQIISHASSTVTDRRQHVESKVLHPVLLKKNISSVEMIAVTEDLNEYPSDSRNLLKQESNEIIELKRENSAMRLAEVLVEAEA